jgi:hypothetical protein
LIAAVRDAVEGRHPIREKGKIVDWQIVETDPGVSDKRLFILESEFGGVLRAIQREGNRLSALVRQAWDNGGLRTLTKVPMVATDAHISITAHITGSELLHLLSQVDFVNGFSNRFWWFAVRGTRSLPFGGTPPGLNLLSQRLEQAVEGARGASKLGWTDEGKMLWASTMYEQLKVLPVGRLGEVLNRAAPHVLRMAGLYCLADGKQAIEPSHLLASKALWDSSVQCATYIFGDALGDPVADTIAHALRDANPDGLTRTELHAALQRHHSKGRIQQALAALIEGGLARENREPGASGRLVWKYYAHANSANPANLVHA